MLELKNICKTYNYNKKNPTEALKNVSIAFREKEFVSILGPSGCGKTTLLNIIAGLDNSSSGEVIIDGELANDFNGKKWDSYRANKIGFIFQNYNLINNETVLENVMLALSIKGIDKKTGKDKALNALKMVELSNYASKKACDLSGGERQRVAIARVMANYPEIILADEATGALDEATSYQILSILRKLSKKHLIINVTHNSYFANEFSDRIIKMDNGEIISDSNPYVNEGEYNKCLISKKTKLRFNDSLALTYKNLLNNKKSFILTMISSMISIICLFLVLCFTNSVNNYVSSTQKNLTSATSIELSSSSINYLKMIDELSFSDKVKIAKDSNVDVFEMSKRINSIYNNVNDLVNSNGALSNDYINYIKAMNVSSATGILYDSGMDLTYSMYTKVKANNIESIKSIECIRKVYQNILGSTELKNISSMLCNYSTSFMELVDNNEFINSEYDITGRLPQNKNELLLVLDSNGRATDLLLGTLGFYSQEEFMDVFQAVIKNDMNYKTSFTYDDILNHEFYWQNNDNIFIEKINEYTNKIDSLQPFFYKPLLSDLSKCLKLKIVGIARVKDGQLGAMRSGFYYTNELKKYIIEQNINSKIVNFLNSCDDNNFPFIKYNSIYSGTIPINSLNVNVGITYKFDYYYNNNEYKNNVGFLGGDILTSLISTVSNSIIGNDFINLASISLRQLGGDESISRVVIFSKDTFERKRINEYLNYWNSRNDILIDDKIISSDDRKNVEVNDTTSIVMSILYDISRVINIVLFSFLTISLLISQIMIFIVTFTSVSNREKEIGILRSFGTRKKDISFLFILENLIIGFISGAIASIIGLVILLLITPKLNEYNLLISNNLLIYYLFGVIILSTILSVISGLIPALKAMNISVNDALKSE